jgi:hypothetical protein
MTKDNKKTLEIKSVSRRKVVKQIVGGVSALAAYNMLPARWDKPVIEQIFLPVHAAVSGITLSDPCTAELVSGNQETSIDVIRASGFVTPPVGGLDVTIVATPNGGSGGPVSVATTTASDGTFSAEITMVGGPGIVGVGVTTTVAGVNGAAHCSVGIPPADHPSAQRPTTTAAPVTYSISLTGGTWSCNSNVIITFSGKVAASDSSSLQGVSVSLIVNGTEIATVSVDASNSWAFTDEFFTPTAGSEVVVAAFTDTSTYGNAQVVQNIC